MKKILLVLAVILSIYNLNGQRTAQQELDRAIYMEEVDGNLDQALDLYQKIIKDFKGDRSIVAEALYRTGLVNEKLGNQKAVGYYENIVNNYSDQSRQLAMARKRLNTIYASMNTAKKDDAVTIKKIFSSPGRLYANMSSDGKYLMNTGYDLNLELWDIASGDQKKLTSEAMIDSVVMNANVGTWSMDNRKHAFNWHHGNGVFSVKIWDRETGKITEIGEPGEFVYPLNWTKGGKKILAMWGENYEVETHRGILDLEDGSKEQLFTLRPGAWGNASVISPDGKYVIYSDHSERGDRDLYLYDVINRSSRLISGHSAEEGEALWAHDGKSIIFISSRSGNPALYRWKFENGRMIGEPELIYEGINNDFQLESMTPGGEVLLKNFHREASIFMADVDLNTGRVTNIFELFDNAIGLGYPQWSPDGTQIAMVRRNDRDTTGDHIVISDVNRKIENEVEIGFSVPSRPFYTPLWTADGRIVMEDAREERKEENWRRFLVLDPSSGEKKAVRHPYNWNKPVFVSENTYYLPVYQHVEVNGIFKIDMETGEKEMIYTCPENTLPGPFMSLSHDKKYIAFSLAEDGDYPRTFEVIVMDLNDHSVRSVFTCKEGDALNWIPAFWTADGRNLLLQIYGLKGDMGLVKEDDTALVKVDLQSKEYQLLPPFSDAANDSLTELKPHHFILHPDGNKVLYNNEKVTTNYWVLKY